MIIYFSPSLSLSLSLSLQTLLEGLSVGVVVTHFDLDLVVKAFVITTGVFLALTVYTMQSKYDFSTWGARSVTMTWSSSSSNFLFFLQSVCSALGLATGQPPAGTSGVRRRSPTSLSLPQIFFWSEAMEFVVSVGGALLFCGFILFDTHLIMHKLSPEEYVMASVNLYLDFINLFIYILRILQHFRRD